MRHAFLMTLMAGLVATVAAAQPARGGAVQDELIRLDKELAAAEAKGDIAVIDRILAADYTVTDQTGRVGDKAHALEVARGPHASVINTDQYDVRVIGDTAVMTHRGTIKGAGEAGTEQLRTTHVWVRRNNRWQLVADQCTSIQHPQLGTKPFLNAACSDSSFEPQVVQYFGDSTAILKKLAADDLSIGGRRTYVLLVETSSAAELTLFERTAAGNNVKLWRWSGASIGDLRERLADLMLANRGLACIGQQLKAVINAAFHPADLGTIPPPVSAQAAFSHRVRSHGAEYMRATIFLLC